MHWEEESLFEMESFVVPVDTYRITSRFGDRRTYRYSDGTSAPAMHTGIDLAAPTGTPVAASGAGRVVLSADRMLTGGTVVIEHLPGIYSLYYHLDSLDCVEGEEITRGQLIGTVGMTGLATGPHLHWEFRVSGVPVDPFFLVEEALLDKVVIKGNSKDENTQKGGD
jgi:murein DD-endopeptidase MepM/ murein hydrolase activator NlpD